MNNKKACAKLNTVMSAGSYPFTILVFLAAKIVPPKIAWQIVHSKKLPSWPSQIQANRYFGSNSSEACL